MELLQPKKQYFFQKKELKSAKPRNDNHEKKLDKSFINVYISAVVKIG